MASAEAARAVARKRKPSSPLTRSSIRSPGRRGSRLLRLGQPPAFTTCARSAFAAATRASTRPATDLPFAFAISASVSPSLEARAQRVLGDAEVACGRVEIGDVVDRRGGLAAGAEADERHVACGDPRLQLVTPGPRSGGRPRRRRRPGSRAPVFSAASSFAASTPSCFAASATIASLSWLRRRAVGSECRAAADRPPRDRDRAACDLALSALPLVLLLWGGVSGHFPVEQRGLRAP